MIYIASPFFNEKELNFVKAIEAALDEARLSYYSPRDVGILMELTPEEKQQRKEQIYLDNIVNIQRCSHMVAVIDDRDVGTIWEMGYATAASKNVISISNQDYGLNVMLAESVQAHVRGLEDMVRAVRDPFFQGELVTDVY